MTYAAMIFFILAVMSGLFGFTSVEGGPEPSTAALGRLLAVVFGAAFMVAAIALVLRRGAGRAFGEGQAADSPVDRPLGGGLSASERGSWDGSRRRARPGPPPSGGER